MKVKFLYFLVLIAVFVHFGSREAYAQTPRMVDSSEYVSIVQKLQQREHVSEGNVRINQSSVISRMLEQNALSNQHNQIMQGYRIRIYSDNDQNSRQRSEQLGKKFKERYPNVGAYRSYSNPYFVVSIGDFRTVDDAIKFQNQLAADYGREYSSAYIIKDDIYFPPVNNYELQH